MARYQSWTAPYPLIEAQKLIAQMQERCLAKPRAGEWNQIAIQTEVDPPGAGRLIGDCAFRLHTEDVRQANIGFTIAMPYQRRGYATEAVQALLGELFQGMGLHRVTAVCDTENISRHVPAGDRVGLNGAGGGSQDGSPPSTGRRRRD